LATCAAAPMALVTLQTLCQEALPASAQPQPLPAPVRTAVRALLPCRSAALGGPIPACPDGPLARLWSNACRHRACPHGADLQTERWWALQRARLLAWDHAQGLCTLPPALTPRWLATVPVRTPLLLQAGRATLGPWLAAPTSLGAPPGRLAALPTWSHTRVRPPHVHGLVPGGGRTPAGQGVAVRHGLLLLARVGRAVLRGQIVDALRQPWARGAWALPAALRPPPWGTRRHRLGHPRQTQGPVRLRERSRHGAGVVPSRARDRRGGPSTNARRVAWDGAHVICSSRPRAAETDGGQPAPQRMPWPVAALLPRGLRPVPGPHTRVVRSYGRYPHPQAAARAAWRTALGHPLGEAPGCLDGQTGWARRGEAHPERCPTGGLRRVCTGVSPRGGAPPSRLAGERAAGGRHTTGSRGRADRGGLAVARWWPSVGRDAVSRGSEGPVCGCRRRRGGGQGLWQAGGRGGDAAQTPERVGAPRVRPHPYAVRPTKCSPQCSGPGVRPPRGSLP
jgi:Transposase zinc-binding domain/Putative transposase